MAKFLLSKEELALAEARDRSSQAEAELRQLCALVRKADDRARNLAGDDPVCCEKACREARELARGISGLKTRVQHLQADCRELEPAARAREARRQRPRQERNGHSVDRGALARAEHAAMLARMGYIEA